MVLRGPPKERLSNQGLTGSAGFPILYGGINLSRTLLPRVRHHLPLPGAPPPPPPPWPASWGIRLPPELLCWLCIFPALFYCPPHPASYHVLWLLVTIVSTPKLISPFPSGTFYLMNPPCPGSAAAPLPPLPGPSCWCCLWENSVDIRTGRDESGRAAPCAKWTTRPLTLVGEGSRDARILQFFQPMQAVHFRLALLLEQAQSYRSKVGQVKCLVQFQHRPNWLLARLTVVFTKETVQLISVGIYPFVSPPTDVQATVKDDDPPQAIDNLSWLLSRIKDWDLHQENTSIKHHWQPRASLRPHHHYTKQGDVCVFVCVCVCVCV